MIAGFPPPTGPAAVKCGKRTYLAIMIQAESNDIGSLEALTGRLVPSPDQQRPHNHIDQLKALAASAQSNLPMPTPRCKVEAGLGTGTSAGTLNGIGR